MKYIDKFLNWLDANELEYHFWFTLGVVISSLIWMANIYL